MSIRGYSELECFVLGVIWQLGPCSPYDIRQHLAASPSTQWSASAGAIYPLVRKLEKRRLLRSKDQATGKRKRRVYVITPAGKKVLQSWIGPPIAAHAITVAHDPLRTRARFLGVMTPMQRLAWVRAALAAMDEVERRVTGWQGEYGVDDPFLTLITRNGQIDVDSRRAWLREVADVVGAANRHASPSPANNRTQSLAPSRIVASGRRTAGGRGG
jgi:DNA-binding PadR family transcriptional regulator